MSGIGSHQSAKMLKDEWLTPPEIMKPLLIILLLASQAWGAKAKGDLK